MLDGAPVQPQITQQDARTWLVGYTGKLDIGKHEPEPATRLYQRQGFQRINRARLSLKLGRPSR